MVGKGRAAENREFLKQPEKKCAISIFEVGLIKLTVAAFPVLLELAGAAGNKGAPNHVAALLVGLAMGFEVPPQGAHFCCRVLTVGAGKGLLPSVRSQVPRQVVLLIGPVGAARIITRILPPLHVRPARLEHAPQAAGARRARLAAALPLHGPRGG